MGIVSSSLGTASVNHNFHVYDLDTDSFVAYNLGSEHIPVSIYWDKKEVRCFGVQAETSKQEIAKEQSKEESEG